MASPLRSRCLRCRWRVRASSLRSTSSLADAAQDRAGGRPRAWSRRCRSGCRRHRAAGRAGRRRRGAAAAGGSAAAPARPAPGPPACGRSGRRCRGSRPCGRWPCARAASRGCTAGPGDSSLSNTTVSASTARHSSRSSSALPLPMNHVWSGWSRRCTMRAGLVGAGGVDQRGELVEAGVGVVVGDVGERDADEHDALPDGAVDERGAERFGVRGVASLVHVHDGAGTLASSTVATNVVGPVRVIRRGSSPSNATIALPPSMCTTIFPSRGVASPHRRAAYAAAHGAGAARLGDAGAALVHPHRDGVGGRAGLDDLEVDVRQPWRRARRGRRPRRRRRARRCAGCRG